ncbi:MAG: hypothetical protein A2Y17_12790 [Clostridiales bacterium GWF2_38_85]|nr:MAG: hypothetical protein A2Y17_12790 [Clostridiales bacterium GWF2_38_85]HBL84136.1 hypothetical protein [Clostridiales bacterium]
MSFRYHKFFMDQQHETEWLNYMAVKGLVLFKKSPLTYYFELIELPPETFYKYRILTLKAPVENGDSEAEITEIAKDGSELACGYKCFAYFRRTEGEFAEYNDAISRKKHYSAIMQLYLSLFLASVAVLNYQIVFAFKQKIEEEPIVGVLAIILSAVAALSLAVPLTYYTEKFIKLRKEVKLLRNKETKGSFVNE